MKIQSYTFIDVGSVADELLTGLDAATDSDRTKAVIRLSLAILGNDGRNWTQNTLARDENDFAVTVNSDDACYWCFVGAMFRAVYLLGYPDSYFNQAHDLVLAEMVKLKCAADGLGELSIGAFNDTRSFNEVRHTACCALQAIQ